MIDPTDPLYNVPTNVPPAAPGMPYGNPYPNPPRDYVGEQLDATRRASGALDPVQPIGVWQSSTIKSLIGGLIVVLGAFGFKIAWNDAQVDAVTDGVIAFAAIASSLAGIAYRIRAERKVVVGARATDAKSSAVSSVCVAMAASLAVYAATGGCAAMFPATSTPTSRVYGIKYAFTQAVREVTDAVNAGMFDNRPDILRAIPPARRAVEDALNTAMRLAQDPAQKSNVTFWIEAADKALQHYVELTGAPNRSLPTTVPTSRPAATTRPGDRPDVLELRRRAA
jgi:hypothetical protein